MIMDAKNKEKVLVTGCNGMLGTYLAKTLSPTFAVTGIDIDDLDIVNWDSLYAYLQIKKPDIIVNAAAFTDVDGTEDRKEFAYNVNVVGVENLATAATLLGMKLVHISSDYVFDGKKRSPYKEDDGPHPVSAYGETKWLGDKALLEQYWNNENDNYLIVRTAWLFGKEGKDFVSKIVEKIRQGALELQVVNDQTGSPTYAPDLAQAIVKLLEDKVTGIINVTNSGDATWYGIAEVIKKQLFADNPVKLVPVRTSELNLKAKRPVYSVLDSEQLEFILGDPLRPWQDALREYLKTF